MIDLGKVRPGSTVRIPFSTFDKDDGSSITMTNYAAADILVYKDGGTTERASTSGYTATTDFDAKTGKHLAIIDLADNTTAGFFSAGSEYLVAIDAVTVDGVTTGGFIARFRIAVDGAVLDTTIASLSSQTSFTLTAGPAEDDALNGCVCYIHDVASAVQGGFAQIIDYVGSTRTVTLAAGTTFTAAATDNISIMPPAYVHGFTAGALTAAAIASDAITAAKVADDVSTEFRTKALALTTCSGVVGSGSTTANVVASSVAVGATTSISADAWKGRVIIFNSDTTTAALRGQAAVIVSHTSGSTPTFTVATASWTTAPLSSDTFTVV